MRAYVITEPGGPEKLELKEVEKPSPRRDWVLIRNRAFGLNRSEWFTRRGDSPTVSFPRVLGIECVGEVVEAPDGGLDSGETVAAMMGGMGRQFDGSYAEYVLVPRANVFPLRTELEWTALAALPEMLQTVHGSLYTGLEIDRAQSILVRGATSSIGFSAMAMDKNFDEKLEPELQGILNWLIDGCLAWQKTGVSQPLRVSRATNVYLSDNDLIKLFIKERVVDRVGTEESATALYTVYKAWAQDRGDWPLTMTKFGTALVERGLRRKRRDKGNFYIDIKVFRHGEQ